MRILDRYVVRQLLPVWVWCLVVFVFLSCLVDLFGHLDEILQYRLSPRTVLDYYLNFAPQVFVQTSPLALLLASAFIATRLSRYQEFLAMNASGTSLSRAAVPFVFVGWVAAVAVFLVNDRVVPRTSVAYERIRQEAFRGKGQKQPPVENVAIMDAFNRLYHARLLDVKAKELHDLTILEHDWHNRPTKSLYAHRAVWTRHGWLLLNGTIYRVGPRGVLRGDPEPFMERLYTYPVTIESFRQPLLRPDAMRYGQLRLMISRLKQTGIASARRYQVDLAAKLSFPFMNLVICLLSFAGSTQLHTRGHIKGLGTALGWGVLYYLGVATALGLAKEGFLGLPALVLVWSPHAAALWWSLNVLRRTP